MLVGNGDGHLRFYLQQLVFHIQNDLLQHPLGILGLFDKVVHIRSKQCAYSVQQ
jgi:hypothetical protein